MEQPETNSIAELCAALVKAQSEFPKITKGETADAGKYKYTYASLAAVLEAVTPALNKNGLALIQIPMDGDLVTTILHESGERLSGNMAIPKNLPPQELGSWISYLRRYSAMAMTGVAADDDDDGKSAQDGHKKRGATPPLKQTPPPQAPPQEPPRSDFETAVRTLFNDGKGALIGNVDDPTAEMTTRMTRVLGGMGFERASEITDKKQQTAFLVALGETVDEIRKQHPSPVS